VGQPVDAGCRAVTASGAHTRAVPARAVRLGATHGGAEVEAIREPPASRCSAHTRADRGGAAARRRRWGGAGGGGAPGSGARTRLPRWRPSRGAVGAEAPRPRPPGRPCVAHTRASECGAARACGRGVRTILARARVCRQSRSREAWTPGAGGGQRVRGEPAPRSCAAAPVRPTSASVLSADCTSRSGASRRGRAGRRSPRPAP
jgi:hypothetical protein